MSDSRLHDAVTFDEAAKRVGMCRDRCRDIAFRHSIAIPWGSGTKKRHFRVRVSDLETAILQERTGTAQGSKPLHRLVKC